MLQAVPSREELELYMRQFVARERGMDVEQIAAQHTLRTDLGMDGDDAVEFFAKYEKEFGVDLMDLGKCWSFYFGPEGWLFLTKGVKLALIAAASAGVLEWLLLPGLSAIGGLVTVTGLFLLILVAVKIAERINARPEKAPEMQEITVGELVDAARSGRWIVPEEILEWVSKQKQPRQLT